MPIGYFEDLLGIMKMQVRINFFLLPLAHYLVNFSNYHIKLNKKMKKIALFLIVFLAVGTISAQELDGYSTDLGRNSTFVKNGFWDNWFAGAGIGTNLYFGENNSEAKFMDRLSITPNIQTGTWFNPYYGLRFKLSGGTFMHSFVNKDWRTRNRYIAAEFNFMWNVSDYLLNYDSKRIYSFIPYIGLGYAYGWDYRNVPSEFQGNYVNSLTVDAGIINRFRLTDEIHLDLEFSGKVLRGEFDGRPGNRGYDGMGTVSANLIVGLGKTTFTQVRLHDQSEIDALNRKINAQQVEIQNLLNRSVQKEKGLTELPKGTLGSQEPISNVVLFDLGRANIERHQEVNIFNIARFLRDNPERKVRVVGFTDKTTGTPESNERLSRERSKNVAEMLINTYRIAPERVIVQWEGQSQPPFNVPEWDRCVILYIE